MNSDPRAAGRQALAEADKVFADTGDVMLAIQWIAFAARAGEPIPPHLGRWLHKALQDYHVGPPDFTMDAAMGLDRPGKLQPRRRSREAMKLNEALGRMWFLMAAGANRKQAAVLVASVTGRQVEQLMRSYGESWFARRIDQKPFDGMAAADVRNLIEDMLGEYPDSTETEQEKAAIRRQFPV